MKAKYKKPLSRDWPVTHDLTLAFILSLVVVALAAGAAVAGLLNPDQFYPSEGLANALLPTDLATLFIILPVALGSMFLARRGKLIGLLCWPGAMFAILYTFLPYLLAVPFNSLWMAYLLIVPLSAAVMIGMVAGLDGNMIAARLQGSVPARVSGGILVGLAVIIILRQGNLMFSALSSQALVPPLDVSLWIADFALACTVLLTAGAQLWRRRPFGYLTGGGLLMAYGMLSLGLMPYFFCQPTTGAPLDVAGIIIILIMAALCLIPFSFFVRGANLFLEGEQQ